MDAGRTKATRFGARAERDSLLETVDYPILGVFYAA